LRRRSGLHWENKEKGIFPLYECRNWRKFKRGLRKEFQRSWEIFKKRSERVYRELEKNPKGSLRRDVDGI
jgi:hypothetical protein